MERIVCVTCKKGNPEDLPIKVFRGRLLCDACTHRAKTILAATPYTPPPPDWRRDEGAAERTVETIYGGSRIRGYWRGPEDD